MEEIEYRPIFRHFPIAFTESQSAWGDIGNIILDIIKRFNIPQKKALEFGVEYGHSISCISNYFIEVIGVDTFEGDIFSGIKENHFHKTKENLKAWPNIKLIKSDFKDFIKTNNDFFDLIHIDIIHNFQETFDCGEWAINHSKIVIFHDTESFTEVKKAVKQLSDKFNISFHNYPYSSGLGILIP